MLRNRKQHDPSGRAAFIAGKKLGNAVWRNRAKRRMRSICKDLNYSFNGYDVVFLAKRSVNITPYNVILNRTKESLKNNFDGYQASE